LIVNIGGLRSLCAGIVTGLLVSSETNPFSSKAK